MSLFDLFGKPALKNEVYKLEPLDEAFVLPNADMKEAQCRERSPRYPEFWRHWNEDESCFSPLSASESIAFEESVKDINRKGRSKR